MYGNLRGYSTAPGMGGFLDKVNNWVKKGTDLYNANAATLDPLRDQAIWQGTKSYQSSSTGTAQNPAPNVGPGTNNLPPTGMSTGVKVALGLLGVAVVGGGIWALTSK